MPAILSNSTMAGAVRTPSNITDNTLDDRVIIRSFVGKTKAATATYCSAERRLSTIFAARYSAVALASCSSVLNGTLFTASVSIISPRGHITTACGVASERSTVIVATLAMVNRAGRSVSNSRSVRSITRRLRFAASINVTDACRFTRRILAIVAVARNILLIARVFSIETHPVVSKALVVVIQAGFITAKDNVPTIKARLILSGTVLLVAKPCHSPIAVGIATISAYLVLTATLTIIAAAAGCIITGASIATNKCHILPEVLPIITQARCAIADERTVAQVLHPSIIAPLSVVAQGGSNSAQDFILL
uniref:Uncharacterized protein n=1 Tax=Pyrodinium bahamense TaxID=73915 RepID=A0A7S0FIV6_9DINO|mmetsp:Transcript_33354/g.92202  ORF Transcript_33354/g.92202 Transcript_33354/m.92202 type:complete len:308 (+) Transcript_33354:908-1831(+)